MDLRKDRLIELLLVRSFRVREEPPFILSSGRTSPYYLDCKTVSLHPEGLNLIGALGYDVVQPLGVQGVGGLTLGADPIACAIAMHSHTRSTPHQAFVVRKEAKGHGTNQWIEGNVGAGDKVVVVDDVVTTGGSTLLAIERARAAGLVVEHVLILCDREEGGRERLTAAGVAVHALVTLDELRTRLTHARAHAAAAQAPA